MAPVDKDSGLEILRGIKKELTESNRKLFYLGILLGAHVGVTTLMDVAGHLPQSVSIALGASIGMVSSITLAMMGRKRGA